MKNLSATIMTCLVFALAGCDVKDDLNKPKTQVRTMIIGGMPASEQDYKIPDNKVILAEHIQRE